MKELCRKLVTGALVCIFYLVPCTLLQAQEHSYAPSDIENGRGLYQANCLGCHGNDADAVEGANLSTGRFRRASSDEDLIRLIREGIPNTLMIPKTNLSYGDTRAIVAFLRALPSGGALVADEREVRIGDAARGEALFFSNQTQCSACHGVNGGGNLLSPDLSNVGATRTPATLETAMLDPIAEVRAGQRFYQVTNLQGNTVNGLLLNQDTHSVQLLREGERLASYQKEDLQNHGFIPSPMPSYLDVLSPDEVSDLVAYMISLKGEE
ncbi:c-type cytochrome [Gammaproteobacteria bacterium]|nr:c-type cytochrome [Gammaproteobacteria bacterium]